MNVFAYGTLMFPAVAERVAGIRSWGEPATLRGFRRETVRLQRRRGRFPAIVPGEKSLVHGLLLRNITDDQLRRLDAFEEVSTGSYVREIQSVNTGSGPCDAFVYVAGKRLISRLSGEWDPQSFLQHELDWYLEHVVHGFVNDFA